MKKSGCLAVVAACLLAFSVGATDYRHEMKIVVTGYAGETLADMPLLVRLTEGVAFRHADSLSDGADIRFFLPDGTSLPHEIETWNPAGESVAWVRVPELKPGLEIRMKYGLANDTAPDPKAVWSDYTGVWHMNGSAEGVPESAHGYDAKIGKGERHITWPTGMAGGSYFNAAWRTNDYPRLVVTSAVARAAFKAMPTNVTFSCWIRNDGGSGYYTNGTVRVWFNYARWWNTANGYYLNADMSGLEMALEGYDSSLTLRDGGKAAAAISVSSTLGAYWHHFAISYGDDGRQVYVDGARLDGACNAAAYYRPSNDNWTFGYSGPGKNNAFDQWVGGLDEFRVWNGTASPARIAAECAMVNAGVDYCTFASVVTPYERSRFSHALKVTVEGFAGDPISDYRLLVRVSERDVPGFRYADSLEDGKDVFFELDDGTVPPHECDTWNPSGESTFWVRVPELRAGLALTMHYGAEGVCYENARAVWNDHAAVWHMNVKDGAVAESAHGFDGTVSHATCVTSPTGVAGGSYLNAEWHTNGGPCMVVGSAAAIKALNVLTGDLTLVAWVRNDGKNGFKDFTDDPDIKANYLYRNYARIWRTGTGTPGDNYTGLDHAFEGNASTFTLTDYGPRMTKNIGDFSTVWHQLVIRYANGERRVWFDASEVSDAYGASNRFVPCKNATWYLGGRSGEMIGTGANAQWVGGLDEVRIYPGAMEEARIVAEYDMIRAESSYLRFTSVLEEDAFATFARYVDIAVSGYAGTTPLTNFPVAVRVSPKRIWGFKYAAMRPDGRDILFATPAGVLLDFDVDTWDPSGESLYWVRLPELANGATIRMYYGREEPFHSGTGAGQVWSGYAGVWHLSETADGAETLREASCHGIATTGGSASAATNGVWGVARGTSVTGKHGPIFRTVPHAALDAGETFTVSAWLRWNVSGANWAYLFSRKESDASAAWGVQDRSGGTLSPGFWINGSGSPKSATCFSSPSHFRNWVKVDIEYDGCTQRFYIDGVLKNGGYDGTNVTSSAATQGGLGFAAGGLLSDSQHGTLGGDLDEVRYSVGLRSADWRQAEIDMAERNNGTAFLTYSRAHYTGKQPGTIMIIR